MKIGMLGGLTPQATIEYYKLIIKRYQQMIDSENFPEMIIESVNVSKVHHLTMGKKYDELVNYLGNAVKNLAQAGANIILIASNTPHLFIDEIQKYVSVSIISIVEESFKEIIKSKKNRIGLLGTIPIMQSDLYKKLLINEKIDVFVPNTSDQEFLQDMIFRKFSKGIFIKEETDMIRIIIDKLKDEHNIDGLILGCTELPIFLKQEDWDDILLFDTTSIHVEGLIHLIKNSKR
jgi:aspartate racemase